VKTQGSYDKWVPVMS